jgi:uncharacterized membrane-anchored protein YhcB (DUF1043 family)
MKSTMWLVIIVALLVGAYAGYYYEKTKMVKLLTAQQVNMQQQIDSLKTTISLMPTPTPTVIKVIKK